MDETSIFEYITGTFEGVQTVNAMGATFFSYDPEHKFPFATIVTNDEHDQVSNLNRPSVFRLNIGISKPTFQALFGSPILRASVEDLIASGYDFTALNQLMPHPVYGRMYWVCILNPSTASFDEVIKPLLAEAYTIAVRKHSKPVDKA